MKSIKISHNRVRRRLRKMYGNYVCARQPNPLVNQTNTIVTTYYDFEGSYAMPGKTEQSLKAMEKIFVVEKRYNIKSTYNTVALYAQEIPDLISDFYNNFPKNLAFEFDVLPVRHFNFYRQLFKADQFVDGSPFILNVRMIKSDWEIEQIEKAAELSRKTFEYMRRVIRPGLSEIEFAGMFETFARRYGHGAKMRVRDHQTEGYPWHVLSGKSGGMVGLLDSPASGAGRHCAIRYRAAATPQPHATHRHTGYIPS